MCKDIHTTGLLQRMIQALEEGQAGGGEKELLFV